MNRVTTLLLPLAALGAALTAQAETSIPHLRAQGTATQLVVEGRPFLVRGGEIGNSTATNPEYLQQYWPKFAALKLNTILAPVYWHLIEPQEGRFEFSTVDQLLAQARANKTRLVLLWFGSWKNSMSCYAPDWVKLDTKRFPRATDNNGVPQEILTPFSDENRETDARAFRALCRHLRETDAAQSTVIMIQVENEIGMLPTARDHSPSAERAYAAAVPEQLMAYFDTHRDELVPEVMAAWRAAGGKRNGTWVEVFGTSPAAEEIFMAWHFARYTDAVAMAGKTEHPLPMFVNAALNRPGHMPGQYPSAGPLPHLMDVWRAAGTGIDFLSPDIYYQAFGSWARRYVRPGNPLFVPEAMRTQDAAVNGLYAIGGLEALGFSPFGIESIEGAAEKYLAASYGLLQQLEPLVLAARGKGTMAGLLSEGVEQRAPQQVRLGDYVLEATFERGTPPPLPDGFIVPTGSAPAVPPPAGGLVIAIAPDEFFIAGSSLVVTFAPQAPNRRAGILNAEEGRFVEGRWENILWLSGDQTHQGRHIRLEPGRFSIQRVKLYSY